VLRLRSTLTLSNSTQLLVDFTNPSLSSWRFSSTSEINLTALPRTRVRSYCRISCTLRPRARHQDQQLPTLADRIPPGETLPHAAWSCICALLPSPQCPTRSGIQTTSPTLPNLSVLAPSTTTLLLNSPRMLSTASVKSWKKPSSSCAMPRGLP
jgi:hypothetical protein